ncbi:gamete and mating-type specific protein A-like, partial [Actinia tenebrosa]|uniref:Gamete and mating-type specific protein A-like n=1 Tax=Actinia tenebrosa TaxID=6105 RepID=A0A6P8HNR6_ACTTE
MERIGVLWIILAVIVIALTSQSDGRVIRKDQLAGKNALGRKLLQENDEFILQDDDIESSGTDVDLTETLYGPTTSSAKSNVSRTPPPSSPAQETQPQSTPAPETRAPSTAAPDTQAPSTAAPDTQAPSTAAPDTQAPSTAAPETQPPSTAAPDTQAPSTAAPHQVLLHLTHKHQ